MWRAENSWPSPASDEELRGGGGPDGLFPPAPLTTLPEGEFVREKVHTWRRAGFTLELWDTHVPTGTGRLAHTLLAYRLSDRGRTIFAGDGFPPPLGVCIDSDECVAALLSW